MSGLASPNYKHGRFSTHLPAQLAARYEEARANPRLLSLMDDVALAEARLAQLLEQVDTGESGACWEALRTNRAAFKQALAAGDLAAMNQYDKVIDQLVEQGSAQGGVWEEIRRTGESRRKFVETEMKTLTGLQQMVTVQQQMLMLGAVAEAVVQAVQEYADVASGRKILTKVQAELVRLSTLEER